MEAPRAVKTRAAVVWEYVSKKYGGPSSFAAALATWIWHLDLTPVWWDLQRVYGNSDWMISSTCHTE